MDKRASLTKTSEKNGNDSHSENPKENLSKSISPTGQILQMQQTIGNQAVQGLFKSGAIQAKLKTGQPGNQYEQEADRAANCIMQNCDCRENPLSPVEPQIQRSPANENQTPPPPPPPPPTTKTETTKKTEKPLPGLIVEDTVKVLANGQMKKTQFLDQVQVAVCRTVNSILEGTEYSTDSCPYIQFYLLYYRTKSSQHIERALLRYAPEAAGAKTAKDYINFIIARVAMATVIWLNTGEVTGIPKGFAPAVPGEGAEGEGTAAGISPKVRSGGLRNADNVQAIQSQLGPGQPLNGGVKSRIGSAFGQDFSYVRIHTDANAAQLSDSLNARAFTIGKDIAFSQGEYQPGTLVGDALIAHELAHVLQQKAGAASVAPMQGGETTYNSLEDDADHSAIGAVASLWGGIKNALSDIAQNATPRLRSGLHLSRCKKKKYPTVDQINIIDSPAGAIGGYPALRWGNSDVNVPGPFNDPDTGEVRNVHQIHFHLDNGSSSDLTPTRQIQRSAWSAGTEHKKPPDEVLPPGVFTMPGGFDGVIVGPDGPRAKWIQRPTKDMIAIADAPGIRALNAINYPFIYRAHFILTVANNSGKNVARAQYDVRIEKQNAADIPNTENQIISTEKKDLVRNEDLT